MSLTARFILEIHFHWLLSFDQGSWFIFVISFVKFQMTMPSFRPASGRRRPNQTVIPKQLAKLSKQHLPNAKRSRKKSWSQSHLMTSLPKLLRQRSCPKFLNLRKKVIYILKPNFFFVCGILDFVRHIAYNCNGVVKFGIVIRTHILQVSIFTHILQTDSFNNSVFSS